MMRRQRPRPRRGIVLVETAFVMPVTLMLSIGTLVVGLGVYRYNQVAYLARQGSRWASVHGPTYQADQKKSAPTAADVVTNAVTPRMFGLSAGSLTPTLTWNTNSSPATVTFKLTYIWTPEAFLSPVTFRSTSTQLITY